MLKASHLVSEESEKGFLLIFLFNIRFPSI
jgi:hypothetical protein